VWAATPEICWDPQTEDEYIIVRPGAGIVLWQADAGTTTDGRRFTVNGSVDEIDIA
jgi:hypothetical protein